MATMKQRADKTLEFVNDPDVTFIEGLVHSYLWFRYEWAIIQRNRHAHQAHKLADKLNTNLEVISLRKQMNIYDSQ